jgi:hypothetical protein
LAFAGLSSIFKTLGSGTPGQYRDFGEQELGGVKPSRGVADYITAKRIFCYRGRAGMVIRHDYTVYARAGSAPSIHGLF